MNIYALCIIFRFHLHHSWRNIVCPIFAASMLLVTAKWSIYPYKELKVLEGWKAHYTILTFISVSS